MRRRETLNFEFQLEWSEMLEEEEVFCVCASKCIHNICCTT